MSIQCSNCGKELPDGAKFCGGCGNKITAPANDTFPCPNCGKPLPSTAKFCNGCGTKIEAVQPSPITMDSVEVPTNLDEVFNPKPEPVLVTPSAEPENTQSPIQPQPMNVQPTPIQASTQQPPIQPAPVMQQNAPQYQMPQNQNNFNQQSVTPGKGAGAIVPILLIILILAVIAVDVFVLFPDKVFKNGDSSSEAICTYMIDDIQTTLLD